VEGIDTHATDSANAAKGEGEDLMHILKVIFGSAAAVVACPAVVVAAVAVPLVVFGIAARRSLA
jgi:hypothetical protein